MCPPHSTKTGTLPAHRRVCPHKKSIFTPRSCWFVFYGAHVHGEALDPDEIKIIAGLAAGAAAAYDHIEAEALRKNNEAMKNEVDSLRTQLAEAQIQPA